MCGCTASSASYGSNSAMNRAGDFEREIGELVTRYVASANLRTEPQVVVGAIAGPAKADRRWRGPMPVVAVGVVLVIGSIAIANILLSGPASGPAHAAVGGVTYDVVVDRSLTVETGELSPYGPITASDYAWAFSQQEAYSLQGVNPRALLVVPAKPGTGDESWLNYFILVGPADPYPSACRYHDATFGEIPAECSGG